MTGDDVIDLNFDNPNLRKAMIEAMQFWLRETNIDGFRCDVAEMVPPDFWKEATTALRQQKPDIFMLAEAEKPEMHQYFDMTYSWEMHHVWNEVAQGKKTVADIDSVIEKYADNYHPSNYRMYFTSNHDENSWKDTEYGCLGAGAEAFAALTYFLPGMPLIYSGQEAANKKKLQFFEKDAIVWPSKPYPLANFYTQLNRMKLQMPALHNGSFGGNYTRLKTGVDTQVLAFSRAKDNNQIIVVFNLSDKPAVATLEVGNVTGDLIEVFANKKLSAASKIPLNLTPWEHRVFLVSK
ncbi:MAG: alpha-glucosidase C-terminal domain-containing protein [Sphingobacteriales bacterium]|nr:alpha-glucosidase C-terminal domain-containing protein [Sphingobacteriales bacterium]